MPIFEYSCNDCGTRFEKLVRRSSETDAVNCPSCGKDRVRSEYSTFAAHSSGSKSSEVGCASPAPGGGCGSGMCQGGMCGMNFN